MSWLYDLYDIYESNIDHVGVVDKKRNGATYTLLPISHTTQTAHIEVDITEKGDFHSAYVIENKEESNTLIPTTEESSSRAGAKIAPYPLHDKLSYVAGDFKKYGGKVKNEEPFDHYIHNLKTWVESPYVTEKLKAIYTYLKKGRLIEDLNENKIIFLDQENKMIKKWHKDYESLHGERPPIFSAVSGDQESAFVRFNVRSDTKINKKVWEDTEMYDSFILFYNDLLGEEDYCFVSGEWKPITEKHANKIRNSADKSKLISANDTSGFTFRGRFNKSHEAVSISYDVSQKAHNALKWLINRQAKIVDGRVFLVWGTKQLDIPDSSEDSFDILELAGGDRDVDEVSQAPYTADEFADEVSRAISGYKSDLDSVPEHAILLNLDAATTGRLAVVNYRNMDLDHYLENIKHWHSSCVWLHKYRKNSDGKFIEFYGAPASRDIAYAAYGTKVNDKVVKEVMDRMIPSVIDRREVPKDIVNSAFYRVSNPVSLEKWEWEKALSITCALINKKEGFEVGLDNENTERDYLFGRLLALADVLERRALDSNETRATNAIRYMNSFSKHPARTWKIIQESIQPYQMRLGGKALDITKMIDEVGSMIDVNEFNNKALSGKYLLGFYSQRHELYKKKEEK